MGERGAQTDEDRDAERTLYYGSWDAQPRWVKVLTATVAMPAWVILAVILIAGDVLRLGWLVSLCFGAFATVVALQLAFVVKALWRMDF